MYCIVFSGRLLDGYDPLVVRKAVSNRLNLDAQQVERLFCGQRMVLKKGVTEESGRLYLDVLRRLGLDAGMARIPRTADTVQALATFKVVFWGRIQEGFDRAAVMRAAAIRLKASPSQVERMFNGTKAVLKRGVSSELGTKYVLELARIGMQIDLEVETIEKASAKAAKAAPVAEKIVVPVAAPATSPAKKPAGFRRHGDEDFAGLLQTQFELPGQSDYMEEVPLEDQDLPVVASRVSTSNYAASLRQEAAQPVAKRTAAPQPVRTSMPAVATPSPEYVRCEQCGHRQTTSTHCRVCGSEIDRPQHHMPIPMDASAYASPTTILGNMPTSMMRSGVATLSGSGEDLKAMMLMQPEANSSRASNFLHKRAPVLLGGCAAVTVLLWLLL